MARFSQLASVISRVRGLPNSSFYMSLHNPPNSYIVSEQGSIAVNRKGIIALACEDIPNFHFMLILMDRFGNILERKNYSHLGTNYNAQIYHDEVTDGFWIYSKNSAPGSTGDTYLMLITDDGTIVDQIELGGNIEYSNVNNTGLGVALHYAGCTDDLYFYLGAYDQTNNEMFVARFSSSTGSIVSDRPQSFATGFSSGVHRPMSIGGNRTDGWIIISFNDNTGNGNRIELTTMDAIGPYSVFGASTSATSFANHCMFVGNQGDRVIFDWDSTAFGGTSYISIINERDPSTNDSRQMKFSASTGPGAPVIGDIIHPKIFAQRKDAKATSTELNWAYGCTYDLIGGTQYQIIMPFKSDFSISSMDRDFIYIETPQNMNPAGMHFDFQGNVYLLGSGTDGISLLKLDYDALWDNFTTNITYEVNTTTYTIYPRQTGTQINTQYSTGYFMSQTATSAVNPPTGSITATTSTNTASDDQSNIAVEYFVGTNTLPFVAPTWAAELTLNNPDVETSSSADNFGRGVDMSNNYVVVCASAEDLGGTNAGVAYVYDLSGNLLYTLQNPVPSSTGFGVSVAVDGNYIAVGDYDYNSNGRVYVYDITTFGSVGSTITSANYTVESFATAPDGTTQSGSSNFGWQVAMHDGWLVVGAPAATHASQASHGAAYLYDISTFSTSSITSATYIIANPNVPSGTADRMGYSVAIDGKWIAVGIPGAEDNPKTYEGAVYVWDKTTFGAVGTQPAHTWELPNPTTSTFFTRGNTPQIAISEQAGHVLIGSYNQDGPAGTAQGRAYLGDLTTGTISHQFDSPLGVPSGNFGQGVALGADGRYAFIVQEDNAGSNGYLYIFDTDNLVGGTTSTADYSFAMGNNRPWAVAANSNRAVVANNSAFGPVQRITQHKK